VAGMCAALRRERAAGADELPQEKEKAGKVRRQRDARFGT
jgi:hypothetical protein